MPRKRYKPEEIVAKLRQVDVLTSQGRPVAEAVRSIGVTEVTYYRWRQEYGGLKRRSGEAAEGAGDGEHAAAQGGRRPDAGQDDPARRQPGETSKPRASPGLRRACGWRTAACPSDGVPGARPASIDAAQGPAGPDDEAALTADIIELARHYGRYGYRRIAAMLRRCRLAGQPKRVERIWRREGLKVPQKAAEARTALADGRILHPASAGAPQPCLVLRLRRGPDPRRTEVPHAQHHRRVHPRVPGDPRRPQAQGHRRDRRALRSVHPARRASATSAPTTARSSSPRRSRNGSRLSAPRPPTSCQAAPGRTAIFESFNCQAPGRTAQWRNLLHTGRGPDRHRKLAAPLQYHAPTLSPWLPAACTGGHCTRSHRVAGCATPTSFAGHAAAGDRQAQTNIPPGPLRWGRSLSNDRPGRRSGA